MAFIYGILILGMLVTLHEMGHFFAAILCKTKIEKFSIGFGRKIISRTWRGTEYQIALIPLGGFVQLLQSPSDLPELAGRSYPEKTPFQRAFIIAAGPTVNLILPFILLPLAFMVGMSAPSYLKEPPTVGYVATDSIAQQAGLLSEDLIIKINHSLATDWETAEKFLAEKEGNEPITVAVKRNQKIIELTISCPTGPFSKCGIYPVLDPVVGRVVPNKPAIDAGILPGDRFLTVGGTHHNNWYGFVEAFEKSGGSTLDFTIERSGAEMSFSFAPTLSNDRYIAGLAPDSKTVLIHYSLFDALPAGIEKAKWMLGTTVGFIEQLFSGQVSTKNIGGPVAILQIAGQSVGAPMSVVLLIISFLSIQIGVLNLFPIPVFDGGQLILLSYEAIKGKPLPLVIQNSFQTVGLVLVFMLMVFAFYNDLQRML